MNRRHISFGLLCGLLALLPACWNMESQKKGLFVIDVLDKQAYDDCHIKGAVNVTLEDMEQFTTGLDKEQAYIVVYCTNYRCTTSDFVCKQLVQKGFKHVWAYEGGIAEWYQLGLPVEGPCKNGYLTKKIEKPTIENPDINVITAHELEHMIQQMQASGGIAKW